MVYDVTLGPIEWESIAGESETTHKAVRWGMIGFLYPVGTLHY